MMSVVSRGASPITAIVGFKYSQPCTFDTMAPIQRWQAQQHVIVFQCTGNAILGAVNGVENSEEG